MMSGTLPFVSLNVAITADGKLAPANRVFIPFGSDRDRELLMSLRATADAVMSGARTVDLSPVNLGPGGKRFRELRRKRHLAEYNLRVVVSGAGTVKPESEVFKQRFSPVIILTTGRATRARIERLREVATEVKLCGNREIDFAAALRWLRRQWGVRRLICEGGGEVNDALLRAGLVDEIHVTICPFIFGGRAAPTLSDGLGMGDLEHACELQQKTKRSAGDELFLLYKVRRQVRR